MTVHLLGALVMMMACPEMSCGVTAGGASSKLPERPVVKVVNERALDAMSFFEHLVARYRALESYEDETSIVQVTTHLGEERSHRVETTVKCDIVEGRLNVRTPVSQVRGGLMRGLGLTLPIAPQEVQGSKSMYDLWLAPHMAIKFTENPLSEFRAGVPEGFTATEIAPVTIDNKPMVHLELKSGDGMSGDYAAKFDLYIDPDSMLIERIEGQQRLPDGGDFQTTVDIKPTLAEGADFVRPTTAPTASTNPCAESQAPQKQTAEPVAAPRPAMPAGMPVG
ncbi:MAG TPA: hypothetical protein PK098_06395 [Phycisphaerales bacterium]|nr:hypothetical protein [Phycisphaerales bacterium]